MGFQDLSAHFNLPSFVFDYFALRQKLLIEIPIFIGMTLRGREPGSWKAVSAISNFLPDSMSDGVSGSIDTFFNTLFRNAMNRPVPYVHKKRRVAPPLFRIL